MIPLAVPNLNGNEERYLKECIATNFVSSVGPFVNRFEEMVAQACGCSDSVATSSGTTGLHLALTAVGVKPYDLVVLPSFTFIASANAIAHCGATPWLFDINSESWTLNTDRLAENLKKFTHSSHGNLIHSKTGRRVAAILPVYTLGMPADMDSICAIAKEFELPVIADAAASMGARYRGRNIGGLADVSVCSFNGNKTVTCGGGGALISEDNKLLEKARHLSTTAQKGAAYEHNEVGFNYRMTNLQAALGCAQMEQLDKFVSCKRKIASRYNNELASLPNCSPFPSINWAESACWFSGIVLNNDYDLTVIHKDLRKRGIDSRPFWKPIHLQKPYKNSPKTETPVTNSIWKRVLILPCSTMLNVHEQSLTIEAVKDIL